MRLNLNIPRFCSRLVYIDHNSRSITCWYKISKFAERCGMLNSGGIFNVLESCTCQCIIRHVQELVNLFRFIWYRNCSGKNRNKLSTGYEDKRSTSSCLVKCLSLAQWGGQQAFHIDQLGVMCMVQYWTGGNDANTYSKTSKSRLLYLPFMISGRQPPYHVPILADVRYLKTFLRKTNTTLQ